MTVRSPTKVRRENDYMKPLLHPCSTDWSLVLKLLGFPSDSAAKNLPVMQEMQETWVQSLGWDDPLVEEMATHSSMVPLRIPWTKESEGL